MLDARLPDGSGIDVCRDIRSSMPEVRCLILTSYDDNDAIFAADMAGAAGYLLKEIRGSSLVDGIRQVAKGKSLLDPAVTERLFLAEKTVKNYVSGLLSKLGMERRTQAAVYGAEIGRAQGG